jgi:hypothetical protein
MKLPTQTTIAKILLMMIALLFGAVGIQTYRLHSRDKQLTDSEFAKDSVEAVNAKTTTFLVGQLRGWEQRALQTSLAKDSVDKKLNVTTEAKADLEVQLKDLDVIVQSTDALTEADDVRYAEFNVDTSGYKANAKVWLPPEKSGTMDLKVVIAPIGMGIRFSCGPANGGIRTAQALVTSSRAGISLTVDSVRTERQVCNPEEKVSKPRISFGLQLGAGKIQLPDGTSRWGAYAGYGINLRIP